jgi:hypothetical protein
MEGSCSEAWCHPQALCWTGGEDAGSALHRQMPSLRQAGPTPHTSQYRLPGLLCLVQPRSILPGLPDHLDRSRRGNTKAQRYVNIGNREDSVLLPSGSATNSINNAFDLSGSSNVDHHMSFGSAVVLAKLVEELPISLR